MQVLQVINKQHQLLGEITLEHPDIVNLSVSNDFENREIFEHYLISLIEQFKQDGIPFRTGNKTTNTNGDLVYTEEKKLVKPNDEQFLAALKDAINNLPFASSDQRFFATL